MTSFFDLTSVPLITLGMPLIVYFILLQNNKNLSFRETIIIVFKFCANWGLAYIIIMFSKWLLADMVYNKGLIQNGMLQLKYRSIGDKGRIEMPYTETLLRNFLFIRAYTWFLSVQYLVIFLYKKTRNKRITMSLNINDLLPYIIIVFMCPAWYFLVRQHSFIHAFFTYRLQIVTIIAIQIIIVKILGIYNQKGNP